MASVRSVGRTPDMAQNGLRRVFLCHRCRNETFSPVSFSRPFSVTPRHAKTIPRFSTSSNPELDDLFMAFRTKIFTPHALSQVQRRLVYRQRYQSLLNKDPGITVTMSDDEELRLEPMDPRDRPNKKQSLRRMLELFQDGRDWQNLPALLEGMQLAGEDWPEGYMEQFVRRAHESGQTGIIIRCAERVKKTGLCLADQAVTSELMLGIHTRALKAGFEGDEMKKAVHQAQVVALLLEKPEHCGRRRVWKSHERDMRKDLAFLGVMLELRAAQADPPNEGDIVIGTVAKIAAKVLSLLPQHDLAVSDDPGTSRIQLERWLPLWAGMKLALKGKNLQDPELRREIAHARDALAGSVEQARTKVETASLGKPRRCLQMYNDVKDL